jgi:hypothetical protein
MISTAHVHSGERDVLAHRGIPGLVRGDAAGRDHRLLVVDDLDGGRQRVGIDPLNTLAITRPGFRRRSRVRAGRALLLRAGQTPLETHAGTVTGGKPTENELHPSPGGQGKVGQSLDTRSAVDLAFTAPTGRPAEILAGGVP